MSLRFDPEGVKVGKRRFPHFIAGSDASDAGKAVKVASAQNAVGHNPDHVAAVNTVAEGVFV